MKTQLAMLVGNDHTDWQNKIPAIRFAMNTRVSQAEHTPAFLTFGRELRIPREVNDDFRSIVDNESTVRKVHEEHQDNEKGYADMRRRPAPNFIWYL